MRVRRPTSRTSPAGPCRMVTVAASQASRRAVSAETWDAARLVEGGLAAGGAGASGAPPPGRSVNVGDRPGGAVRQYRGRLVRGGGDLPRAPRVRSRYMDSSTRVKSSVLEG